MSNFTGIHLAILLLAHQIAKSNDQTDFAASSSKIIFFSFRNDTLYNRLLLLIAISGTYRSNSHHTIRIINSPFVFIQYCTNCITLILVVSMIAGIILALTL